MTLPPLPDSRRFDISPAVMTFAMLEAHNAARQEAGAPALRLNPSLSAIAMQRAKELAESGCFSHFGPAGSACPDSGQPRFASILEDTAYSYVLAGENLARNDYSDGQAVSVSMRGFMDSPSHRDNLLNPRYTQVGVGVAIDGETKYFAVIFSD